MQAPHKEKIKIICLHGNSGSKDHFKDILKNSEYFQVVVYSTLGHDKRSCPENIDLFTLSKDFFKFLENNLSENENYILLGHSLGGNIIYHTLPKLIKKPILIVSIGAPPLDKSVKSLGRMFTDEPTAEVFQNAMIDPDGLRKFCKINNLEGNSTLTEGLNKTSPFFRPHFFKSILNLSFDNEVKNLTESGIPTLMINGELDPFIEKSYLKEVSELSANIEFMELKKLHHYPFLENPDFFSDIISEKINEVLK